MRVDNPLFRLIKNIFVRTDWKKIEYFDERWRKRIKTMASYIKEKESVVDLGAGEMWLKEYLVKSNKYMSVDYKKRDKDTIVCDFNNDDFPLIEADVAFVSGCLEYVNKPTWFIREICKNYKRCILSYCTTDVTPQILTRRSLGWVNNLSKSQVIKIFNEFGMKLVEDDNSIQGNQIFVFQKSDR